MSAATIAPVVLALIGCGQLFDDIAANWPLFGHGRVLLPLRVASTDTAYDDTDTLLAGLDPVQTRIFVAIDAQALNHARFDVYAKARLMGFRGDSLRHPSAIVAGNVRVGENCWIGAGAVVAHGVQIGNNTIVGDTVRIEAGARLGANGWVGAGASIGAGTTLGQHCVIGRDVRLGAGLQIGRHCAIDVPDAYAEAFVDGTFIDSLFPQPVRIYGAK